MGQINGHSHCDPFSLTLSFGQQRESQTVTLPFLITTCTLPLSRLDSCRNHPALTSPAHIVFLSTCVSTLRIKIKALYKYQSAHQYQYRRFIPLTDNFKGEKNHALRCLTFKVVNSFEDCLPYL